MHAGGRNPASNNSRSYEEGEDRLRQEGSNGQDKAKNHESPALPCK
jgi:hypothetical protein